MSALATRIEKEVGRRLTPIEISNISAARETTLCRLLMLYIGTGLAFMLLPGTFLGVWNLLVISSHRSANTVSAAWVQAHGHAQIFGWIGTFILGIGFYSIPKLRRLNSFALATVYVAWALWTAGVSTHWLCTVYQWHWRTLLPLSAVLELSAFAIFFRTVSGHRPQECGNEKLESWVLVVIAGTIGLMLALLMNLGSSVYLAIHAASPEIPASFDSKLLVVETWGFLVPFVWGFSAKWLPVFLGLRSPRGRGLLVAVGLNSIGVLAGLLSWTSTAVVLFLAGSILAIAALRLFVTADKPAKLKGVHSSFPLFIRMAYIWAFGAALLGIWAASVQDSRGIWGASRHALTVGFFSLLVFAIGQRVLPAFSGMKLLFSTKLMFASMVLLVLGCLLRVSSEVLAYQGFLISAWSWLPVSAIFEMTAVTIFAINLFFTFASKPPASKP
ncbi:MAG TPA: hypothetical protein VEI52_21145 [Terriglobales bacterium]|nr:hypothetical protein [Terriglobales bacterium]